MKKNKIAASMITGILIGLILGSIMTYSLMKIGENKQLEEKENEKLTITEKLTLEIIKLTMKNNVYNYVDIIEEKTSSLKDEDKDFEIKEGMYLLKGNKLIMVDEETLEKIENSTEIKNLEFTDPIPKDNSMIMLNEKGKITEGVFYVDNFQITYDLLGTKVTEVK